LIILDLNEEGSLVVNKPPLRTSGRQIQAPAARNEGFFQIFKHLTRILLFPFFHLDALGLKHLPSDSAFILLCKHQRWEDIPLLGLASPRPLYYIAKYELFKNRLGKRFFGSLGGIPLNRQRPLESRRYLRATIQLLKKGEGVVIFPEGTYYRDRMGPGQAGVVKFVLSRLTLPFIPVGIHYTAMRRRTRVRIQFGRALPTDPALPAEEFVDRMMKAIARLSGLPAP
jgi:1-acyl-sn-glycerol-3-phosphate acyltransferase